MTFTEIIRVVVALLGMLLAFAAGLSLAGNSQLPPTERAPAYPGGFWLIAAIGVLLFTMAAGGAR
jgi:hypothetical protein